MTAYPPAAILVSVIGSILAGVFVLIVARLARRQYNAPLVTGQPPVSGSRVQYSADDYIQSTACHIGQEHIDQDRAQRVTAPGQVVQVDSTYYNAAKHYQRVQANYDDRIVGVEGECRVVGDLPEPQRGLPEGARVPDVIEINTREKVRR